MKIKEVVINGKIFKTFEGEIAPDSSLVFICGAKGFIMCGYLNIETAEKKGNIAAIVTGVKTLEDALSTRVVSITSHAQKAGISVGMSVSEALEIIS